MKVTHEKLRDLCNKWPKKKWPILLRKIFSYPENIDLFVKLFFPHVMTSRTPDFHEDLYGFLMDDGNGAMAAPRGHAKSTVVGLFYLIWCIVNNKEQYIVYVSQNHAKTVQFLSPIRQEFKTNNKLKYVYGDLTPKVQKDDETGKDREDCFDVGGIRVEAVSFEKNLRGFKFNNVRPTLIVCDDIEDDMRVLNPELRSKDADKLNKIIIPSLDINGRLKMIGTILHVHSLLRQKIEQYGGKIYKACDADYGDILWPDRFNEDKLREIKRDIGSVAFEQEYLNNPVNTTNSIIKRTWLDKCIDEDISYNDDFEYSYKTYGVDFAFSDRITADKSAFISLGQVGEQFVCYDCQTRKGLSISEQMSLIQTQHTQQRFDAIGLEENSIKSISKDIDSFKMPITLFWTAASDPAQKLKEKQFFGKRQTVGKIPLIMRLATAIEHEEIVFPYKTREDKDITERIFSECLSFALADGKLVEAGVHPDIPIALAYALELQKREKFIVSFGGKDEM